MDKKQQKNFMVDDQLSEDFNYWCGKADVNMSQQVRKMMRNFISESARRYEDETKKYEQEKKQTELFPKCGTAQEESSASDEGGVQVIVCGNCGEHNDVYHMDWEAIMCVRCKKAIYKFELLDEVKDLI